MSMKKLGAFIKGLTLGAIGTIVAVWKWEKTTRRRVSTVMDKAYKKAKTTVEQKLAELKKTGQVVNVEKFKKILQDIEASLNEKYELTKEQVTEILERVKKTFKGQVQSE